MSTVRSKPLATPRASGEGCLSIVGVLFLAISVGPLFLLLNGGYSIQGMAWLATHTGEYGRMFWAVATFWTVDIPIAERAGLPLAQPVIPWLMVSGISFLQVGMLIRKLRRDHSEPWLDVGGYAVSGFDYATTAAGLVFAPFVVNTPIVVHGLWAILAIGLAVPLTFGFETLIARVLRGRPYVRQHQPD